MTYYTDLSPYEYDEREAPGMVNVGWLDPSHEFERGHIPDALSQKLLRLCAAPVNRMRGLHVCPFCFRPTMGVEVVESDVKVLLGGAEIRLVGEGRTYAAPDLIYHYVKEHQYRPPDDFLHALDQMTE